MKTFSIRTLLILIAVCGFAFWLIFVPVRITLPCVSTHPEFSRGDNAIIFQKRRDPNRLVRTFNKREVTFWKYADRESVTILMSRWELFWIENEGNWLISNEAQWESRVLMESMVYND